MEHVDGNGHQDPQVVKVRDAAPLALGRKDAAKSISISERTLWQLTKDGLIPSVKIGSRTVYRVSSLEAYLAANEKKAVVASDGPMTTSPLPRHELETS